MPDDAMPRSLFVDFMYAVAVGATIVRIDPSHLHVRSVEFWGVWFLIAVFLEDFYLYHTKVVPNLTSRLTARGLIVEMTIVFTWYVAQVAFPTRPDWFLISFAVFFLLKLLAGLGMGGSYPTRNDFLFLLPVGTALVLLFCPSSGSTSLIALFLAWFVSVGVWWSAETKQAG
ncbi:MAG: hypothetical protein DMG88_07085 [Acidobacteria bacterium]|nr:MAG: hypothetical protein DMG88_07085 [Acidobacteriota bacterium]